MQGFVAPRIGNAGDFQQLGTASVDGNDAEYWRRPKSDGGFDYYRGVGDDWRTIAEGDAYREIGYDSPGPVDPEDPYAKYGGKDRYDRLVENSIQQRAGILDTAQEATSSKSREYGSGIRSYLDQLGSYQRDIDEQGVQNELAKKQATTGILGMVGRGIRQGG